ncbi:MAG: DUF4965 domain-containing protein [Clostridia bacterium]|nr:DUF4965 domain-containing protein [Clostridia bacterium]MBQ4085448.1 DUF4965 domain-containing protein [Clostridia bacterium]
MARIDRLPALPLIANDPYFSIWMPADKLTDDDCHHWAGAVKPIYGTAVIDGVQYRFLGTGEAPAMETVGQYVTPTATVAEMLAGGVELSVRFTTPALPEDLNTLSAPVTLIDFALSSADGKAHEVSLKLLATDALAYDGDEKPEMFKDGYVSGGLNMVFAGQLVQKPLSNCADHITIDWGYLYLAAEGEVAIEENGLSYSWQGEVPARGIVRNNCYIAYDDIASINYFGSLCKAWHARHGETVPEAIIRFHKNHDKLIHDCDILDASVVEEAEKIGGADYAVIAAAAWRHTFAAHKLIATPEGDMAFLSKENDSNGCIGTVDVSYPSIPLFLRFCPELVNAMCRPVLQFASMPVWEFDFAPHDVGRYPYATGQVYAYKGRRRDIRNYTFAPLYLYPAGTDVFDFTKQMPVEECGNMLVMMYAAVHYGASDELIQQYGDLMEKWVRYLEEFGEDPGEQLCTDDFAGHLARNVNLSAKAVVGIACYARILELLGEGEESAQWAGKAKKLAASWLERARTEEATALTFDGQGWSMKYNLVWDLVFDLGLLPKEFYAHETKSYIGRMNEYGLPLDSRKTYTKSDWILWSASMAQDEETFRAIIAPIVHYLRNTETRVPFSDWYDTVTGRYEHFIARSVQGGLYMPYLAFAK